GNGRAVAFLQRQVQTERELNFIRNAFLLEDILQVETEDLPKVVDSIEVDDLIVALKPASNALRRAFFDALPDKASLSLQEQIEFLMPKSLRHAEAAQERVLCQVKALIRSNEVNLKPKS
ncbi:MAG: FliG C-terminal domain-containing protein, partial [Opitutales bacterium]